MQKIQAYLFILHSNISSLSLRSSCKESLLSGSSPAQRLYPQIALATLLTLTLISPLKAHCESLPQALSIQKELYKKGQWDQFFARATYYRMNPKNYAIHNREVFDNFLALELSALARHCQWRPIHDLSQWTLMKNHPDKMTLSHRALSYITLKMGYKKFLKDSQEEKQDLIKSVRQAKDLWPAQIKDFSRFSSPEKLRIKIASLCQ